MASIVTTSITVQFGQADASSHLSAEVDGRTDGLNFGKTSFIPGDDVFFLVYKSGNVALRSPILSGGSVSTQPTTTIVITEYLIFNNTNTATTSKPVSSGFTSKWLGKSLKGVTIGADQVTLNSKEFGVGVLQVTYTTNVFVYKINSPASIEGETEFPIAVVIIGDVP